jgi:hypothetical protein
MSEVRYMIRRDQNIMATVTEVKDRSKDRMADKMSNSKELKMHK